MAEASANVLTMQANSWRSALHEVVMYMRQGLVDEMMPGNGTTKFSCGPHLKSVLHFVAGSRTLAILLV
jgi:hypothetical protein